MDHFTADDGARIAYLDEGAGLPLLCLSGLTRTHGDFRYLMPHLDLTATRVIRMDYRGRGGSDWTGAESYTASREGQDAIQLLDHLGLEKAAILGTSRGGLIGMLLAATAKERLLGLALNDVGPVLEEKGLSAIDGYIGRRPAAKTHAEAAAAMERTLTGFAELPEGRWMEEAELHYRAGPDGLELTYDPALRDSFLAAFKGGTKPAWALFDAAEGLPLALLRGENSDLLSQETADEMRRRRPDMFYSAVPGRAHIPFLDEPQALAVLKDWMEAMR